MRKLHHEFEPMTPEQRRMEAALAGLAPDGGELDLGRVMFELGRRQGRRTARRWQAMTGMVMVLFVASLGVHLLAGADQPDERMAAGDQAVEPPPAPPLTPPSQPAPFDAPQPVLSDRVPDRPEPRPGGWLSMAMGDVDAEPRDEGPLTHHASLAHMRRIVMHHGIDALPEEPIGLVAEQSLPGWGGSY